MKKSIVFFLMCISVFASNIDKESQIFMQGNSLYQDKKYEEAVLKYKKCLKKYENSFKLNLNLGCSYFRLNDFANSRLYFEKALKLNPNDKRIVANLAVLKTKLKDKVEEPKLSFVTKWINKINNNFSTNFISMVFLIFLVLLILSIALLISNRFNKKPIYYLIATFFFLMMVSYSAYSSKIQYVEKTEAVVYEEEVEIFSEPSTGSALLFKLHSGTKVSIEGRQSGFYHISLPNGMNGWANIRSFNKI